MLLQTLSERIWKTPKRVVFTDGLDIRVLKTARRLADTGLARPIVIGNGFEIRAFAEKSKIRLNGIALRKPINHPRFDFYCRHFRKQFEPQSKYAEIRELLQNPLWFSAQMLAHSDADLIFACPSQGDFAIIERRLTGWQPQRLAFSLILDEMRKRVFLFADVKQNPRPNETQLAQIAINSAKIFENLTGQRARVALLSFSTRGSAQHPLVETVRKAVQLAHEEEPHLKIEGELQFDAALIPEIGAKKAPGNALQGAANVFVFPSLNAADTAWRIVKSLTRLLAIGPLLAGGKLSWQYLDPDEDEKQLFDRVVVASNL